MYGPVAAQHDNDDDPEIVDALVVDDEDQIVRDAAAILRSVSASGGATSPQFMELVRAEVLQLFARVDASPELPSIVAGIGNLYESGYDQAAEHMEMAHWGLPHRVQPTRYAGVPARSARS